MRAGAPVGRLAIVGALVVTLGLTTGCTIQIGSSGYNPYGPLQPQQPAAPGVAGQVATPQFGTTDPGLVPNTAPPLTSAPGSQGAIGTAYEPRFQPATPTGPAAPRSESRNLVAPAPAAVEASGAGSRSTRLSEDTARELANQYRWLSGRAVGEAVQTLQGRAGTMGAQEFETARSDLMRQVDNALRSDFSAQIANFKARLTAADGSDPLVSALKAQADGLSADGLKRSLAEIKATLARMRPAGSIPASSSGEAPNVDDLNRR